MNNKEMQVERLDHEIASVRRLLKNLENERRSAIHEQHTRIEKDIHTVLKNMIEDPRPQFTEACVAQTHALLKQMSDLRGKSGETLPFSKKTEMQLKRFEKVLDGTKRQRVVKKTKKKPLSPYNKYMRKEILRLKKQHPDKLHQNIFTIAAHNWATAPENPVNAK
jgi:hypothetical protein